MPLLIFLGVLSVLILVHEFGHFIVAKKIGVRVERFSLGFGPVLLKRRQGATEYCLSAIPLGGYVKMAGDSVEEYKGKADEYFTQAPGKRFWIIFSGPLLNYMLGFLFFWIIFFAGYPSLTTTVGEVVDGYGAKAAGIVAGDMILAVDGRTVASFGQLQEVIQQKSDVTRVQLTISRDGKIVPVEVQIRASSVDDAVGGKRSVGMLGIKPAADKIITERYGLGAAFFMAGKETWNLTVLTYKGLWRMVTGRLSMKESITGPLGIFMITSQAAHIGLNALMHLMALLSISLAIFNVLPLPILDGGHIALLGLEKLRGRMLSVKVENIMMQAGTTFFICLALFVTYNDIIRFFGDKIAKFVK